MNSSRTYERSKGKFCPEKMKEIILYLLKKCGPMTEEKLGILLYFADFDYFEKYEKSLTGATYVKKP